MSLRLFLLLACAGCALDRHATAPGEPLDEETSAAEAGMSTAPPPAADPGGGELADAAEPQPSEDAGELDEPAMPGLDLDAATGMPADAGGTDATADADSDAPAADAGGADAAEPPSTCVPGQPGPTSPEGACSLGHGRDELNRPCPPGREPPCVPCRDDDSPGLSIDAGPPGRAPERPDCSPPCGPCSEAEAASQE